MAVTLSAKKWMLSIKIRIFYADSMLKSNEFWYIWQPVSCSPPLFPKKHICTCCIGIHSLNFFQTVYLTGCKFRVWFAKLSDRYITGDCQVWVLTNPINSKPRPTPVVGLASKQTLNVLLQNDSITVHFGYLLAEKINKVSSGAQESRKH